MFEIGTEELPAAYLPGLIEQLLGLARQLLTAEHLRFRDAKSYGTPRRLVLMIHGLETTQEKPAEEVRGPAKRACFDAKGAPTHVLRGFLRARGGTPKQLKTVPTPKGDYMYLIKPPTRVPTASVLTPLLNQLFQRLHAPKTMRWDASGTRFARPVRWIMVRYGSRPVQGTIAGQRCADRTWVGLPLSPRSILVTSVPQYFTALQRAGIVVDPVERRRRIEQMVKRIAGQQRGHPAPEMVGHGLLDEVTFLVERPVALVGSFDPKYLDLPREVLLASMAKYQRLFALDGSSTAKSADPAVLPKFIAVLDGSPRKSARVLGTFEHILNARLADSLLFRNEDRRRLPLDQMASGLSEITFHEQLGSMADKAARMRALCEPLAEAWRLQHQERQALRRACQLAKADLVSSMVKEFPTLQGVVGKYYAIESSEPRAVAHAIEEHYLPFSSQPGSAGARLPKTVLGMAVAILDKFDTLVGYFGLGIEPTGDQDPFGLRRAAQGIVEVAWAAHRPLPVDLLLKLSGTLEPLRSAEPKKVAATSRRVQQYLLERLYTFEWPTPRPAVDYIDAVLSSPCPDLVDTMDRIVSLQTLNGHPSLLKAAKVIERTRNILRGASLQQMQVDPSRFQEPLEQQLWNLYRSNEDQVVHLSDDRSYAEATTLFGEVFYAPLHDFFDRVLVNAPDQTLQQNRLALLRSINTLYTDRIADLSKLTVLQRGEPS